MAESSFNIERFMEGSGKVDLSDIDWSEVPKHRVTPEARRVLRYFLNTESSTFFYVKTLMMTKAPFTEPELAPFISVWNYEEEFHGRAFKKFLEAYGDPIRQEFREDLYFNRGFGEKIDEYGQRILEKLFPEVWPAVHMVWGVVQEWTTYCAYQALIDRVNHPVLNEVCRRIMKQELRHFAFYKDQARKRLQSKRAQRVTTAALKIAWTPVGDGMSPKSEVYHALQFLFDGMHGSAANKIDQRVRELPGLEWFDMFSKFVVKHQIPRAPDAWIQPCAEASKPPFIPRANVESAAPAYDAE